MPITFDSQSHHVLYTLSLYVPIVVTVLLKPSIIASPSYPPIMSAESQPITPAQFALAIQDLPVENLYAKAHELNNSIVHLSHSNTLLKEYSDSITQDTSLDAQTRASGDKDCLEAIAENEIVIERQRERIRLLKDEVERRGQVWHEGDLGMERREEGKHAEAEMEVVHENGNGDGHGHVHVDPSQSQSQQQQSMPQGSGSLTDEQLRRHLESLYPPPDDGNDADADGGLHL